MRNSLLLPLTLLFSLTACDGTPNESAQSSKQGNHTPEPHVAAPVVDRNPAVEPAAGGSGGSGASAAWEKTKEVTGEVVDQGKEYGEAVLEGSREAYEKTKEKGSEVGSAIGRGTASVWDKTKEITGDIVQGSKEIGGEVKDKAKELYDQATEEQPPAEVRESN